MIRRAIIITRRGGVTLLSTVVALMLVGATGAGGAIEFPGAISKVDQGNVGHHHTGSGNQGQHNSGSDNSGFFNSGSGNSGFSNSGSGNSGFSNSGSGNSGLFNSDSEHLGFDW